MSATAPTPTPPLPALRQDVVLTLPDREQYGARVSRLTDEEIVLVLMLDARDPLTPGEATTMAVEFPAPRGLVRLEGSGVVATHDLVRFRLDGAVDVLQRRDFVRARVVRPLRLAPIDDHGTPGEWIETLTVNVSGNGLLAAATDRFALGDPVAFHVTLDAGAPPVEGRGRVARICDDGQPGIAIEQIDPEARRHIVRFVFEQERIARQRTRDAEL